MDIQTRKLNFIREVLSLSSERIISKLENVLQKEKKQEEKKPSFKDLVGVISEEEAVEMERQIEASCEQIHEDDWQ